MLNKKFGLAGLLMVPLLANAATVTLYGDNIKFTYDDSTLFGSATVVGDNIFFQPTNFRAESVNGQGVVSATDTINVTAEVITDGFVMTSFSLIEQGDYRLSAGSTEVTASSRLQVTSGTTTCGGFFVCSDNDLVNATGLGTVGPTTNWDINAAVNLGDTTGWGSDTLATIQIQNDLSATTNNLGELAWIQKKIGGVGMQVEVSEVPVPAAFWLFGSALGALGCLRSAKSKR